MVQTHLQGSIVYLFNTLPEHNLLFSCSALFSRNNNSVHHICLFSHTMNIAPTFLQYIKATIMNMSETLPGGAHGLIGGGAEELWGRKENTGSEQ